MINPLAQIKAILMEIRDPEITIGTVDTWVDPDPLPEVYQDTDSCTVDRDLIGDLNYRFNVPELIADYNRVRDQYDDYLAERAMDILVSLRRYRNLPEDQVIQIFGKTLHQMEDTYVAVYQYHKGA